MAEAGDCIKVLYDHQAFTYQDFGGVSRYFYELIDRLDAHNVRPDLPTIYTNNHYALNMKISCFSGRGLRGLVERRALKAAYGSIDGYNRSKSLKLLAKGDFDVFHPTYFDPYFLKRLGDRPFVLTIHDMIHDIYPEHYPLDDRTSANIQALAGRADRIIAVSNNTKNDVIRFLGVDEGKVRVIYHGSSLGLGIDGRAPDGAILEGLPERYLLYVGDRGKYKNFYFFLESIVPLLKKDEGLQIVCAGGGAFSPAEMAFFAGLGIAGRVRQSRVSDDTLAGMYRRALALAFPSLYEGFGIPVLEAFACACPTILSNAGSLPEVGGDAAAYFDPKDVASIRSAVRRVIEDEGLRSSMRCRGRERSKEFSWDRMAKETIALYKEVS
jgi:glycosyltransferase involved in cell wall biosynthesis